MNKRLGILPADLAKFSPLGQVPYAALRRSIVEATPRNPQPLGCAYPPHAHLGGHGILQSGNDAGVGAVIGNARLSPPLPHIHKGISMVYLRQILFPARFLFDRAAKSRASRHFLPGQRCDDDLFVVEFPKSGVTWLTFLLANVNAQIGGDRCAVTFFNINDFVPDVQSVRHVSVPRSAMPGYRFFKSHAPYLSEYRKVFYLVRDPRHVMVSYWTFLTGLGWWRGTLEELVADRKHGIRAWIDHVTGWLDGVHPSASFALIRYEDLLANAHEELMRLYRLLGMPVTDEIIAAAVQRSSIERMRELEAESAASHPALKNFEFVRRQAPGAARALVPDRVRELIEREASTVMERLGYPLELTIRSGSSPLRTP